MTGSSMDALLLTRRGGELLPVVQVLTPLAGRHPLQKQDCFASHQLYIPTTTAFYCISLSDHDGGDCGGGDDNCRVTGMNQSSEPTVILSFSIF